MPTSKTALLFCATALSVSGTALIASAQESDPTALERLVVTPNRTPTDQAKAGSKVETVDRDTIEAQSLPLLTDYLTLVPGVAVSSPGGLGTEGSLAIRGAPRRYVKTLYNGIDISDPTATQVQTSYQYLLADGIDSIEVLKGSQSTLYGSDAIAGVISVSTLGGIDLGVRHRIAAEAGSFGTVRGTYGLRAATEPGRFAFNLTGLRTDGISAVAGGAERDAYQNVTADAAGEYRFNEMFSVFGSGLYIDAKADYDDSFPIQDNVDNRNLSEQKAGRIGFNVDLLDGRLKNQVSVQGFDIDRRIRSESAFGPFDADYQGTHTKLDYLGSFQATEWALLQYGADHERQRAVVTDNFGTDTDDDFSLTGIWTQAVLEPVTNFVVTGGVRHDSHSEFGDYTTYRGTASYLFDRTGTRLHSSVGTGFRAPSLYELYAPFGGNVNLQPETSFSFDIGVEQTFLGGRAVADLTFFMLDIDDLIEYTAASMYEQVPGTSKQRGVEASLRAEVNDWLDLGAAYTYTDTETAAGMRNIRVPRHAIALTATANPWEKWTFSASARIVADTVDSGDFELDDYVLVDAKVGYKPTEDTEVFVRVENLFDQDYQTVRGYSTPGISAFAGFKAEF